jgi:ABC-type uncharacterized transport system involved in gliding motility auxiliary subunit
MIFIEFTPPVQIFFWASVFLLGLYGIQNKKRIKNFLLTKKAKYGLTSFIYTICIIGILIFLNIVGYKHKIVKDLTEDKLFTLSEQSVKILHNLDKPIYVKAFFTDANEEKPYIKHTLDQYTYQTNNLKFEIIDPDSYPAIANTYAVTKDGTIVFETKDKKIQVTDVSEQSITSGIIKVLAEKQKKLAYITGHSESTFEPSETRSCSKLVKYLEHDNFQVEKVNLSEGKTNLSDFNIVLIAGPYSEFLEKEMNILNDYMSKGGNLILLLDPFPSCGFDDFLKSWNIKVGRDLIIDEGSPFWNDVATPTVVSYPDEVITKNLPMTFYPHVRSLQAIDPNNKEITMKILVRSSANSWAEISPKEYKFDEDEDIKGPITIAFLAEKKIGFEKDASKPTMARLVVFGDSDFTLDHFIDVKGNKDIIINSAEYLTGEENLISIRPKELKNRGINLSSYQFAFIKLVTMFIIPLFFIIIAVITWYKKR